MNEIEIKKILLFEDDDLIAINKPSGALSIEDGYNSEKTNLRSTLKSIYGSIWAVHRLDKNTSGVILFAKNKDAHRQLNNSFFNHEVEKNYRGIVNGFPIWNSIEVNFSLRINGDRKHRTVLDQYLGRSACTRINRIINNDMYSYLDIFPKTGLTHQIRAHLSAIGLPLLGDKLYEHCCPINKISRSVPSELFLHALSLNVNHPSSKNHYQSELLCHLNFLISWQN